MPRTENVTRQRVAITLATYGLTIAVFLGLVIGGIQIVLDYRAQTERDETLIHHILSIASSGATEAAFQLDSGMARDAIQSLMIYDFFASAKVEDETGNVLAQVAAAVPPSRYAFLTRLVSRGLSDYSIPLTDHDVRMHVGTLSVTVDNNAMLGDFYDRSVRYMLTGLFRNLLLTAILLQLFFVLLSQPLAWLADQLGRVDPRKPEPFDLSEQIVRANNELTTVARQANDILSASRQHLQELGEANREAVRMDERLRQAERLSVVGQLVGGIAHDYNNILAIILGNSELIAPEKLSATERRALESMREAVDRGAHLTSQLLTFSRRQHFAPSVIHARSFLDELGQFAIPILGERHELKFVLGPGIWPCMADRRQLEAALLNLTINAGHATPKDGLITIECFNTELDQQYCDDEDNLLPGDYVCFSVTDTGIGMSAEVMSHAFEPYFTTKEVGKGSGLGLAMVYGFAKQSGGHVKIYSQEGIGTTVNLYLPRLITNEGEQTIANDGPEKTAGTLGLSGKLVMIVEDEASVREIVRRLLTAMQAEVIDFDNGRDALAYARQNPPVDAAILDVILPGAMNGPDIREALKQIWPDLRVAFMSGYSADTLARTGRLEDNLLILKKPFTRQRLIEVLHKLFEA